MTVNVGSFVQAHRSAVIGVAAVLPFAACAAMIPFRGGVANTNVALGLVLLVVVAAATGLRAAGLSAAVSSAIWFNFFLTQPYETFVIASSNDLQTMILLVLVGIAVTEVALWGRRQQEQASLQEGYLEGVLGTAAAVAAGRISVEALRSEVAEQIVEVLDIDACRYTAKVPAALPILHEDGTVTRNGRTVNVDRHGLPVDSEIALVVMGNGVAQGAYLLTAATSIARPTLAQRRVAVALADQVGAALSSVHSVT